MELSEFWTICSANGIVLNTEQLQQFERYCNELRYWNERINLVSRKDMENIYEKHILHSLCILKYCTIPHKAKCLDIGTGGGFPGLPLAIARPDLRMLLIDSVSKKIKMTTMFAQHTALRDLHAKCCRAEDLQNTKGHKKHYDVIVSRAVARIAQLLDWSQNLLVERGFYAFLKGGDLTDEIEEAEYYFPEYIVELNGIEMIGAEHFFNEGKKVVVVRRKI